MMTETPEFVGAYSKGAFARLENKPLDVNPHPFGSILHNAWRDGWLDEASNDDGLDSEGYPIGQPREWSDEELTELRRRERACDDYG